MSIWKTSIPTTQDYPIWAFTDNDSEVVLLRYPEVLGPGDFDEPITWCHASIPQPPKSRLRAKYEELSDSSTGEAWGAYEWFKAGYRYGNEQTKLRDDCQICQDKKVYEDWNNRWSHLDEEPYESAFDERL